MNHMWILTEEYNDYDQHGAYFVDAWVEKPTRGQILESLKARQEDGEAKLPGCESRLADHILAGGGRVKTEYAWYIFFEHRA